LEIALGVPMYVIAINAEKNQVIIGTKDELKKSKMQVKKLSWQKYSQIEDGMEVEVQIRHHDKGTQAKLYNDGEDSLIIEFDTYVSAITPGQSAVYFEGDDVIGGGFINKVLN
jgi:tRNA-specific 2-thiouridylase